eukprot:jgi/Ulvmu1/6835/UM031_0040.1
MDIDETSDAYRYGDLEPLRSVCRALDREEEEREHMTPPAGTQASASAVAAEGNTSSDFGRGFDPRGPRWNSHPSRGPGRGGRHGPYRPGRPPPPPGEYDRLNDVVARNPDATINASALRAPGISSVMVYVAATSSATLRYLTSSPHTLGKRSPNAVQVAFDEGAEMSTITVDAWERHRSDWEAGNPGFNDRPDIGPTHGLRMQNGVSLRSFHGDISKFNHMVLLHLRLGCAVYPVYCTLVNSAPADVVLGLAFRRKYDVAIPAAFTLQQGDGAVLICLGVPPGFGLYFPRGLRERFAGQETSETIFRQVMKLDTSWRAWNVTGKRLTPAQLASDLGSPAQ